MKILVELVVRHTCVVTGERNENAELYNKEDS